MAEFSKSERAELRRLAALAYERELGVELAELDKAFSEWRQDRLLSTELSAAIHEFHQHAARDIWSTYRRLHASLLVARALAEGILTEQDLPTALREKFGGSASRVAGASDDP